MIKILLFISFCPTSVPPGEWQQAHRLMKRLTGALNKGDEVSVLASPYIARSIILLFK